jgi:AraC family transcriptional regulator
MMLMPKVVVVSCAKVVLMQMQFSLVESSQGKMWDGIEAELYDITAGISERPSNAAYTMVLHLSGPVEGTCLCEGRFVQRIIKPGDIDFVPLGRAATWHDKGPGRVARVSVSPALMCETANSMGYADMRSVSLPPHLSINDAVLRHLTLAIVAELESGASEPLIAQSLGTTVAEYLLRRYAGVQSREQSVGLSRRQRSRIVEYIDANLATSLSPSGIAAVAGVSPSRLRAEFKRSFGMPVHQYIIRRRVDYAVRLLSGPGARVCDVAQQAGFSDQSHLARFMRRIIGTTPAAFLRGLHH